LALVEPLGNGLGNETWTEIEEGSAATARGHDGCMPTVASLDCDLDFLSIMAFDDEVRESI
jgi:hypothetical protein